MRRVDAVLALCLALGACATAPGQGEPVKAPFDDARLTVDAALARVEPGRSTREQVAALLGPAETLRFDSGWEAWVYRQRDAAGESVDGPELVLLFEPAGVLRKARTRAAPPPAPRR